MSQPFLHRTLNPHDGDFSDLSRYLSDPVRRAELNAERDRKEAAMALGRDRAAIAGRPETDDEPGWLSAARERAKATGAAA